MKRAKLFWVDLEMTGLDPEQDRILEVAAIATDWSFNEIAIYESVVKVDESLMESRMVGDFWEKFSDVRTALQDQNKNGKPTGVIENELLEFLTNNFGAVNDRTVILAGNSIHQDRKFIDREWPHLAEKLHYRMLDVSAFKLVFDGKYKKRFAKPEAHRALDDIRGSIEELRYYLEKVKV